MINNKYLKEWIKNNYPMMEFEDDSDLCELDFYDMDNFADYLVKKLSMPAVVGRSEQLPCGDLINHNFSLSKIGRCITCDRAKEKAR